MMDFFDTVYLPTRSPEIGQEFYRLLEIMMSRFSVSATDFPVVGWRKYR